MASTDPTGYISIPLELIRGLQWKRPVACATTANITLSGTQTIDGHAATAGERVLVKNQTSGSQNGIWVCAAGAWTRAFDMDQDLTTSVPAEETMGAFVYVVAGTVNGGTLWFNTNTSAPTLGTTALTFTQFTSGSALTIKDEGSALATAATSIDFVGAGVVASGTGAGKTVTISGTPTGAAGGALAGTYPNPTLVATAVRDAGRWEPVIDTDGSLVLDGSTPPNVLMDWTTS